MCCNTSLFLPISSAKVKTVFHILLIPCRPQTLKAQNRKGRKYAFPPALIEKPGAGS